MLRELALKFSVIGNGLNALNKVKDSYNELKNQLKNSLAVRIQANFNDLKEKFSNTFNILRTSTSRVINNISSNITRIKNRFSVIAGVGVRSFSTIIQRVQQLGSTFTRIGSRITSIFSRASSSITRSFTRISTLGNQSLQRILRVVNNIGQNAKTQFTRFSNYATQSFEKARNQANGLYNKLKQLLALAGAGMVFKIGFESAANMEQYRNTLETVLKDPKLAQQKLAWAGRFANRTPFETEEVVGAMTKLQSYGMEGDRILNSTGRTYLEMIGDMAAGMGKSFDQAVEALADSRTGELERLKEFGITKNMIGDFAKIQGYGEIFNNKGQINDLNLFNKALFELMNSRFGGAMEKQAKTFKGAISTIKGVFKSDLATITGIDEFGNAITNSPFQIIRDKVLLPLADTLVKFQEDGVFRRWAEQLANGIQKVFSIGKSIINFCIKWKEILIPLASAITGLFVLNKVIILIGALKFALSSISFNPIIIGIGAVIAAGVMLYRNWDIVKEKVTQTFQKIKEFSQQFAPIFLPVLYAVEALVLGIKAFWNAWDSNLSIIDNLKNSFSSFFSTFFSTWLTGLKDIISSFMNFISKVFEVVLNNPFIQLFSPVTILIKGLVDGVREFWNAWDSNLSIIDNLKNGFGGFFGAIKDSITNAIENFTNLGDKIRNIPFIKKIAEKIGLDNTEDENITVDGSHRNGLTYVPRDNYVARLHEGERVLTKAENKEYSYRNRSRGNTYYLNFQITNSGEKIDYQALGEFIIKKIKEFEDEREIAEGLI